MLTRLTTVARVALFVTLAIVSWGVWAWWHRIPAPPTAAAPSAEDHYLRAAHWFGNGWPVNFWDTDLERTARADFASIREDAFNAVVLLVPWQGFAPSPTSGALDQQRVERLRRLIRTAAQEDLRVVLRLSYAWDAGRAADGRFLALWSHPETYAGWLEYLEQLWSAVGTEANLEFGFFSWEDLWAVTEITEADVNERLRSADAIGFRTWLREHYSLQRIAESYERSFSDWNEIPVPQRDEPGFGVFLEFLDAAWIERFYSPARQRFQKLSMEVRIDEDPVWRGGQLLRWYSHTNAWRLPDARWTSVYWSPSMGGVNQGETVAPEEAVQRLERRLRQVAEVTAGRPVFIDQLLVEDYTPGFERNGRIPKERIGEFLRRAAPILSQYSDGYAVWTWRDYRHQGLVNPEFFGGVDGWHVNDVSPIATGGVELAGGGWIEQPLTVDRYHVPAGPLEAELCVTGLATGGTPAELRVTDEANQSALGTLLLQRESSTSCLRHIVAPRMTLRLAARSRVSVARVESTGFVQHSGLRDLHGTRKAVARDYIAINLQLMGRGGTPTDLIADGWTGRRFISRFDRPAVKDVVLTIQSDLPSTWPSRPRLSLFVDDDRLGTFSCASGLFRFAVPDGDGPLIVRLEASSTGRVAPDAPALGCHFSQLELEPEAGALGEREWRPLHADGWMGRHFRALLRRPAERGVLLAIRSDLPPDWPLQPRMSVFVAGNLVGDFDCGSGGVRLPIANGRNDVEVRIEGSAVHRPPRDGRELSCHISQLQLQTVTTGEAGGSPSP